MRLVFEKKWSGLFFMVAVLALGSSPLWAGNQSHSWWKVGFDTPVAFSQPQEIGLDAVTLIFPAEAKLGEGKMEITLVAVPKKMQEDMGFSDPELLGYVKSTFLATSKPAEKQKERTFMGARVQGDVQSSKIPKPLGLETYLVPLKDGDKIVLGFSSDASGDPVEAERIIALVAETLKEIPLQ